MNPMLEHLLPEGDESFFAKAFDLPNFGTPWHYHPEYELVLVKQSHGKRFIGNTVSDFQDGDLSLLGSGLPHLYKNPIEYYTEDSPLRARSIIVHFNDVSLGPGLLQLPQFKKVRVLLKKSGHGLDFFGKTREVIIDKMHGLLAVSSLRRLILLLDILEILSETSEYQLISDALIVGNNKLGAERLDKVFSYIAENFRKEITIQEMADLVCMTRTSFCRFFLECTKRTFYSFLIEMRLNHASNVLISKDMTVMQAAYDSGYSNLSNFNRQFREKFNLNPREYRKIYRAVA
ncbi:AraC family transcriptional regulator [Hymenobacter terrenus]|uniref:AraC family transcriptional regulator n=1 Tax=Hymenobacter terrenus TaxID=1629124 RepID=UPI0006191C8F|nr:AraC family transcriptional regulator [Hymenobacter terrenus]